MLAPDAISPAFLNELAKRIVGGESLVAFSEWFVTTVYDAQRDPKDVTPIDDQARRMLLAIARQFWSHMPRPTSHWRALPLPKIERNDPCYCGSGKKYKQCCAQFSSMRVPFESDVLFALALDCIEPDALTANDWVTLPPLALAQAATFWSERGDDERVAQVLGAYFSEHPKLDERSEPALDALYGALQTLGLEQERMALAIRLSEHKNKSLATTARCRHVVMLTDRGDFAAAWKIFEQAQRAHPTDPQLTHLEMMVLLSEGKVLASGRPGDVMREDILSAAYGVKLMRVEGGGRVVIAAPTPFERGMKSAPSIEAWRASMFCPARTPIGFPAAWATSRRSITCRSWRA